ncbi:MAG: SET domain-containing protein-lysine N-methyltransferase [bacterium]|jgi:hypothetical protein
MSNSIKYQTLSQHEHVHVVIDPETGMKGILSSCHFKKGDIVFQFTAKEILSNPSYLTIQLGEHRHILMEPDYLQFANHSCDPNFFIDTERLEFIALKDIQLGDELLFFYPSTEWKMDRPFQCECGSPQCIGIVSGAYALSEENRKKYKLSNFIASKLADTIQQ